MRTPDFWQRRGLLSTLLLPLSALYRLGFALDVLLTRKQRAELPVISIGNITAGGAGKTPTTIALAEMLREMGEVPHIISRGYGGRMRGPHRVDPARDHAANVGDEALLLAVAAPTWVSARRIDSARAAQQAGATILLADDALQHHALAHDLSVLVVDLSYGFGNGRLLPAGPLRQSLASADGGATQPLLIGAENPHGLLHRFDKPWRARLMPVGKTDWLRTGRWLAFAGIAHPQKFYATLHALGAAPAATQDFPDHHPFTEKELVALQARAQQEGLQLITTAKDAARLSATWRAKIAVLPVTLQFDVPEVVRAQLAAWLREYRHAS